MTTRFPSVSALGDPAGLRARLAELDCDLPCDDEILPPSESPLAQALGLRLASGSTRVVGNRFVIQPMEGWDATESGEPSELTRRRWQRFGSSGAGWIWGGEAGAVRADGRANDGYSALRFFDGCGHCCFHGLCHAGCFAMPGE